jgi:hypothetical protein
MSQSRTVLLTDICNFPQVRTKIFLTNGFLLKKTYNEQTFIESLNTYEPICLIIKYEKTSKERKLFICDVMEKIDKLNFECELILSKNGFGCDKSNQGSVNESALELKDKMLIDFISSKFNDLPEDLSLKNELEKISSYVAHDVRGQYLSTLLNIEKVFSDYKVPETLQKHHLDSIKTIDTNLLSLVSKIQNISNIQ